MRQLAGKPRRNIEKKRPAVAYSAPVKNPIFLRVHMNIKTIINKYAAPHDNED